VIEPLLLTILKDHELNSFFTHRSNRYLYLMEDLAALGLTAMDIAWLARYNNQIPISDTYQALGVYYVLEGSTLGGQIICQQLTKQFANEIQNKLHFYHGYGQNTQTYWQQFSQIMNHHFRHSHLTDQKLAIQTAQITFEQLRLWLNKE
jgi:heme oxygenase